MLPDEIISRSAAETEAVGERFATALAVKKAVPQENAFVALYGGLGAGKTAFVRGMAKVLAPGAEVHSPTYTIVNTYENPASGGVFYHFDMYRIKDEEDLLSIGFYDYNGGASAGGAVFAVEWCENIPFALPESYYRVEISGSGDGERSIKINHIGGADE